MRAERERLRPFPRSRRVLTLRHVNIRAQRRSVGGRRPFARARPMRPTGARLSPARWRARSRSGGSSSGCRSRRWAASRSISRPTASRSLWLPAALTVAFAALAWVSRARPVALGAVARARGAVRRLPLDVAAHRARRRAGARPHPHRRPARLRRGGRPEAGRGAHGDRGRERRRHAARKGPAPGARHDAQDARRRRGRLRRAEGAAPAALARGAARRLRFRPRRLLRRRRRGRLDARRRSGFCRRPATRACASASRPRSTTRATASRSGSTGSSAATRARSPPRW